MELSLRNIVDENLRNWFKKEKWKRIDTQGNIKGDCGTMPKGKKTQRCLPAAKAGEEMVNFAKDVYDTPTIKRLRAYVKKEVAKLAQKLVDKYGTEKQMKIPFPEDEIEENLRNWFKKEKWVRIDTQGNIAGKCGTMKKGKATTRCLPRAKANSLTKKQRAATARKKVRGSKKGKQFVKNTKKATVRLKKK